jgi:mannose-6-phosphate isomerase
MQNFKNYNREERPWGYFERFTLNEPSTVKIISVLPNQTLSLQQHEHRDEEWKIIRGSGEVIIGETTTPVKPGDEFFVARQTKHRVIGGPEGLQFLEVSLGDFDEKDIVRFEDKYGRT